MITTIFAIGLLFLIILFVFWSSTWFGNKDKKCRFLKYLQALLIKIKYRFNANIVWMETLKRYIVFCKDCGEYISKDGLCSNSFCPERIDQ